MVLSPYDHNDIEQTDKKIQTRAIQMLYSKFEHSYEMKEYFQTTKLVKELLGEYVGETFTPSGLRVAVSGTMEAVAVFGVVAAP